MINLKEKIEKYLVLIKDVQDASGFIESHECDSLLFTGLVGCVPGVKVDIDAAYDSKSGTWHRRPLGATSCCGCWNPENPENKISFFKKIILTAKYIFTHRGNSDPSVIQKLLSYKGSTISRDMFVGLAWFAWTNRRLDISEQIINYALRHFGVMGKGDPFRINLMPGLFSTFCWISYRLGGPSRGWARWIPADLGNHGLTDYQAHLQVLHILLRRDLEHRLSTRSKSTLESHARRQPRNPLFQYATGNFREAAKTLCDETMWPTDRLPTQADRKSQWLPMRDDGKDWLPESANSAHKLHSGGDFLFVAWLLSTIELQSIT